jgi:DNA-binding MarR family transcriptional regulator
MVDIKFNFQKPEDSSGFLLWQVTTLWQRKIKKALDKIDITHTQFVLMASLAYLSKKEKEVNQILIAHHSKTDPMMVSKVLRTLVEKQFITRAENKIDTRAKNILLTEKGKQLLQKALILVGETDTLFFESLKDKTKKYNKMMIELLHQNEM